MNFWSVMYDLCMGFGMTLKLFALTLLIAIPLGLLFCFCSMSKFKPLSWLMKGIIWIMRGTPLLLQCVIVTFIPSVLLKIPNKDLLMYLGYNREGGNSSLTQIMDGNPTVKRLEPVADFFKVSMDVFFNRNVPFTPLAGNVVGNGNAVGTGNSVITAKENECQLRIEALERLIEEKDKRIEVLEMLVTALKSQR